jgi:hypothetical protein
MSSIGRWASGESSPSGPTGSAYTLDPTGHALAAHGEYERKPPTAVKQFDHRACLDAGSSRSARSVGNRLLDLALDDVDHRHPRRQPSEMRPASVAAIVFQHA